MQYLFLLVVALLVTAILLYRNAESKRADRRLYLARKLMNTTDQLNVALTALQTVRDLQTDISSDTARMAIDKITEIREDFNIKELEK